MILFLTGIYTLQGVNAEPSPVTLDQANAEPLRNEISTDVGAALDQTSVEPLGNEISTDVGDAAKAGPGEDPSPQNQGDS